MAFTIQYFIFVHATSCLAPLLRSKKNELRTLGKQPVSPTRARLDVSYLFFFCQDRRQRSSSSRFLTISPHTISAAFLSSRKAASCVTEPPNRVRPRPDRQRLRNGKTGRPEEAATAKRRRKYGTEANVREPFGRELRQASGNRTGNPQTEGGGRGGPSAQNRDTERRRKTGRTTDHHAAWHKKAVRGIPKPLKKNRAVRRTDRRARRAPSPNINAGPDGSHRGRRRAKRRPTSPTTACG